MARNAICLVVASLGLACCGSSGSTCTPNGTAPTMGDGGDCCGGSVYAGKCAPKDCWTATEISNGAGSLADTVDPSGGNCCASNGASMALSPKNVDTYYCKPIPGCTAGGSVPPHGSADYCCSARTYDGVCEPTYPIATGAGPDQCVLTSRAASTDGGVDCCAGAGASDGFCLPRSGCTASGTAAMDADGSDCCSGATDVNGACCSLTGQPGGNCCGGNGVDSNGDCNPPASCTAAARPSVSPDGSDCCTGFASVNTGLCASPPEQ